jgi:serine/threonine protein phosphatase PrpC
MSDIPVIRSASESDVGMRRMTNQDSLFVRVCRDADEWRRSGHLFIVADGMGGHAVGDLASRIAVKTLSENYFEPSVDAPRQRLQDAMLAAVRAVNLKGRQNPEFFDMGTTCSALSLTSEGALIAHIGDSRVYRVRGEQIAQLTFDHSLQWEMIRLGRATTANVDLYHPRNVITRCVGPDPDVRMDLEGPFPVESGDRFVICSDGLSNHVPDAEIGRIAASLPPENAARLLIQLANCRGGSDNITAVVVEVETSSGTAAGSVVSSFSSDVIPMTESASTGDSENSDPGNAVEHVSAPQTAIAGRVMYWLLAGCLLAAGGFLLQNNNWFLAAVVVLLLMVLDIVRLTVRRRGDHEIDIASEGRSDVDFILTSPDTGAGTDDDRLASKSPYRQTTLISEESLLSILTQIRSELVNAASDSDSGDSSPGGLAGWQSDWNGVSQTCDSGDNIVSVSGSIADLMEAHYRRFRASDRQA